MHAHSPTRLLTLIVWMLGRFKKMLKMCQTNIFFDKYQDLTDVSTSLCQWLYKNVVRSVALVTKESKFILDFTFFH